MANTWLRLWHDMPNDPKWRTIARIANQPITNVISVYLHMLVCASNATERGRTHGWNDEDVASALDLKTEAVIAIREAMQGRVLEEDYLTGWEKRQPKREDNSATRSKEWRDNKNTERNRTQPNAPDKDKEEDTDTDTDTERKNLVLVRDSSESLPERAPKIKNKSGRGMRLTKDWELPIPWGEWALSLGMTREAILNEEDKFRDYWISTSGAKATKNDWEATWRNWIRNHLEKYAK